jgi:hypothetical protein
MVEQPWRVYPRFPRHRGFLPHPFAAIKLRPSSPLSTDTTEEKDMMTDTQTMEKQGEKTMKEEKGDKLVDRKMTGEKSIDEGRTMEKGGYGRYGAIFENQR